MPGIVHSTGILGYVQADELLTLLEGARGIASWILDGLNTNPKPQILKLQTPSIQAGWSAIRETVTLWLRA